MVDVRITEEKELCNLCDRGGITDSIQFRVNRRARLLAESLVDEAGLFNNKAAKAFLKKPPLPANTFLDDFFNEQAKVVINYFLHSPEANLRLKRLSFPLANGYVEDLIRTSLLCNVTHKMTKRDISVSVVMALLATSRQHVGSCFATAPLLMISRESPERLLKDIYEVITRGSLKRVIDGKEYRVPLSIRTGPGETHRKLIRGSEHDIALVKAHGSPVPIREGMSVREFLQMKFGPDSAEREEIFKAHTAHPLLKALEYTIAAFSDFTIGFSRWNFITALGLTQDAPGGLGELIRAAVQAKLDESNAKIQEYIDEINHIEIMLEGKQRHFRSATSQEQMQRMKRDIQTNDYQLHNLEILHEDEIKRAEMFSKMYKFFLEQYDILFPLYFQEVYDPEMVQDEEGIIQDSIAGFRLLTKHGRGDPRVWTLIESDKTYIDALIEFFQITEVSLMALQDSEEGKDALRPIVDEIIRLVQEESFLKGCYHRIEEMHKETLKEWGAKTPYAYPSGGSSEHLLRTYLPLNKEPEKISIEVTSPKDMLHNLIEYMKDIPYQLGREFEINKKRGMLITNPLHAFVFYPGLSPFFEAWQDRYNTYSYVRDNFIEPAISWLNEHNTHHLTEDELYQYLITHNYPGNIPFADTNWCSDFFTFFFDPTQQEITLARTNNITITPLPQWKHLFAAPHVITLYPHINQTL